MDAEHENTAADAHVQVAGNSVRQNGQFARR
jgi:hypothetical protein